MNPNTYTKEEEAIIIESILSALKQGKTLRQGAENAQEKIPGRSIKGIIRKFEQMVPYLPKPDRDIVRAAQKAAQKARKENGKLDAEAIQKEASSTGQNPFRILGASGHVSKPEDELRAAWKAACTLKGAEQHWAKAEACARARENGLPIKKIMQITGSGKSTVQNYVATFRAFPRREDRFALSFSHHVEVARHPAARELLQLAVKNGWESKRFREEVRRHGAAAQDAPQDVPEVEPVDVEALRNELHLQKTEVAFLRERIRVLSKLNAALLKQLASASRRAWGRPHEQHLPDQGQVLQVQ